MNAVSAASFRRAAALGAFALFAAPALPAQSAYLPEPGETSLTPLYSYQRTREFHALGDRRLTLSDPLEQHTVRFDLEHGFAPGWALDAAFGWSSVTYDESSPPFLGVSLLGDGQTTRDGLIDSRLGLRRLLLDETTSLSDWTPTLAVRAGAIVAGTYETGFVNAVGDGANGAELSLLAAKSFPASGTAVFADVAGRAFDGDVPDAIEASIAVSQRVREFVFTLGLRHQQSLDGLDILGPGFITPDGFAFPAVREVNTSLEAGVSLPLGPVTLGLGYARTLAGENTPRKEVYALSGATSF